MASSSSNNPLLPDGSNIDQVLGQISFPHGFANNLLNDELASYETDLDNATAELRRYDTLLSAAAFQLDHTKNALASTTADLLGAQSSLRHRSNEFRAHLNDAYQARDILASQVQALQAQAQTQSNQVQLLAAENRNFGIAQGSLLHELQQERNRSKPLAQRLQNAVETLEQVTGLAARGVTVPIMDYATLWNRYEASKREVDQLMSMSASVRESEQQKTRDDLDQRDALQARLDELEDKKGA